MNIPAAIETAPVFSRHALRLDAEAETQAHRCRSARTGSASSAPARHRRRPFRRHRQFGDGRALRRRLRLETRPRRLHAGAGFRSGQPAARPARCAKAGASRRDGEHSRDSRRERLLCSPGRGDPIGYPGIRRRMDVQGRARSRNAGARLQSCPRWSSVRRRAPSSAAACR